MATKYTDPLYDDLDRQTQERLGLPDGLLQSIRTKGERSNSDQVSEAGAKTVYQITPATRKLAIDRWGIDPYLNEKNASLVAGNLLKDSLDRYKGDVRLAAADYHAGPDRSGWGPRTRAYVGRVTGENLDGESQQPQRQSRSLRAELDAGQPQQFGITQAYQAYKSGNMPPDVAAEFESDVNSGKILLPRGAALKNQPAPATVQQTSAQMAQPAAGKPVQIPQEIAQAYANGTMPADVRAEMEADIKAGRAELPTLPLGEDIKRGLGLGTRNAIQGVGEGLGMFYDPIAATINAATGSQIPTAETHATNIANALGLPTPESGNEKFLSAVQRMAASNAPTIGIGGLLESAKAAPKVVQEAGRVLAETPIQQAISSAAAGGASEAARQAGADTTAQVLAGLGGGVAGVAGANAARAALPKVKQAATAVREGAGTVAQGAGNIVSRATGNADNAALAGGRNVGAAETEVSAMRRANAADLPVPVELTKGQATREFGQQQFEREIAKNAELGGPVRERLAQQNEQIQQNLDAFIDASGAQATDLRSAGVTVDKAVRDAAAKAKTEIRVAYKQAEKAGETLAPVGTQPVVDVLNSSSSAESLAPILGAVKKEVQRLGGAIDENGNLIARDMTLGDMETLRKFINKNAGIDPTNIKYAADLKRAIDGATEGAGGELYNRARRLRSKFAKEYENRAVISDLLNRKRGSDDRKVAFEDVVDRVVNRGSLDDVRFARKVLQTSGEEGRQAWREIQGATLQGIKDQATKNVARDERGNAIISPASLDKAIKRLESDGKLDFIFGKRGAEQLRTLNDVSKTLFTAPPGSVNTSNTASIMLAAMDLALAGSTGVPLPVAQGLKYAVKNIKDRKLKARVRQALEQPAQPKTEKF